MRPDQILDKAADTIVRNGWVQRDWYLSGSKPDPADCPVCASAAINLGADYAPDQPEDDDADLFAAFRAFAQQVDPYAFKNGYYGHPATAPYPWCLVDLVDMVANWNDHPDRTAEQVVAALRACATRLREQAAS